MNKCANRRLRHTRCAMWAVLLAGVVMGAAQAESSRDLTAAGHEHFANGCYEESLESYKQALEAAGEAAAAELLHNRAAAHFKLGQIGDAREYWVRAASRKDEPFEARARYNLGNCDYADALKAVEEQNASKSIELLERAMKQYKNAVRLDPTFQNARANLELAAKLAEQIKDQTSTQPSSQSQPSSQPSQQNDNQQQDQSQQNPDSPPSSQPQPGTQPSDEQEQEQEQPGEDETSSQPSPPEPQDASDKQQEGEQKPGEMIQMTPEEAERLLQKIRDAEQRRRIQLRLREAAKYKPADKDW